MSDREKGPSADEGAEARLPDRVRRVLPADTAKAWLTLAPHLPNDLYLGGGTAVAVYLGHRESRDLDFFFDRTVDLSELKEVIGGLGAFAITHESEGTLKGLFGATKVEIFDASQLRRLAKPTNVAGLRVASIQDLMAMKLKVMAERGEMRDYFDVKAIDENGIVSVEEGIGLYIKRYDLSPNSDALPSPLPGDRRSERCRTRRVASDRHSKLQEWWGKHHFQLLRNSNRFG